MPFRALACLFALAPALPSADYLDPDLRFRVERLKQEAASAPTTPANIAARADVLWDWANAYSLTGGPIPQDLPVIVRTVRGVGSNGYAGRAGRIPGLVDFYIYELALKDERPDAVPTLSLSRAGPIQVRSWQTFEQTVTIGSQPMAEGGKILVGRDGFNDHGMPQTSDPAADNYLSIRSSNPRARFVAGPGSSGISLPTRILASFTLQGGPLRQGDTVTLVFGDRSGGSRGMQMQTYTVDRFHLPLYVDLEGRDYGLTPDWPSVPLVGLDAVARIHAVAPSVVEPGEAFELAVRSDDLYYNRASANIPEYEVLLNGQPFRKIPAGDNGLTVLSNCTIDAEGVYRFRVRSPDGKLVASSNPVWVKRDPAYRVWWGDTHAHTKYAEGQGSPDGFYRFARDDARLDFVTLSEHDIWLDDHEWRTMRELAERYRQPGRFIPILGYEWTNSLAKGGHHNVLFRDTDRVRIGTQVSDTLTRLYAALRRFYSPEDTLTIPHAHTSGDWDTSDGEIEKLVEIASVHGTFEYFGNLYLQRGWQVGFIASTDNHHGHPGYSDTGTTFHTERNGMAAVLAPEKTRESIFSGLRGIRAYATSGDRIILDVSMDGAPIGSRLPAGAERRLRVRAMGTAPIDRIDVIKNGQIVYGKDFATARLGAENWLQIAFSSSSEVYSRRPPRQYRTWEGTLRVVDARVAEVENVSFDNQHQEWVRQGENDPGLIRFRTLTRGRSDVLLVKLEELTPSTKLQFDIDPSRIARGREYEEIPGESLSIALGDADEGILEKRIVLPSADGGEQNVDAIRVQIFDKEAPFDRTLEYTDRSATEPGDYYYVRVTQIDGERAWSSPIWVGGKAR